MRGLEWRGGIVRRFKEDGWELVEGHEDEKIGWMWRKSMK